MDRESFLAELNEDFEKKLGPWSLEHANGKIWFRQGGNERYLDVSMDAFVPAYALVQSRGGVGYAIAYRHELPAFWEHIEQKNAEAVETLFKWKGR